MPYVANVLFGIRLVAVQALSFASCLMPLLVYRRKCSCCLLPPFFASCFGTAADTLIGVDLSEGMLEAALDRGESGPVKGSRPRMWQLHAGISFPMAMQCKRLQFSCCR